MKRFLIGVLAVLTISSLVACNNQKKEAPNTNDTAVITDNTSNNETDNHQVETMTNDEMYAEIISDYQKAKSEFNFEDFEAGEAVLQRYNRVSDSLIQHVARYESEGVKLTYCFYDIDKNGVDELLVGANGSIGAIYSYNLASKEIVKVFFQDTLERGNLVVYDNGVILSEGAGGAALHYYEFGKIGADGTSYELLEAVEEEYIAENEPPVYSNAKTEEVLEYKSLDEIMDKYLLNAQVVDNSNYSEM